MPAANARKKAPRAEEAPADEREASEIEVSDGNVINLKFQKNSYLAEIIRKHQQKHDLERQIDGWKTKTKKAREVLKQIDYDLEAITLHFIEHQRKIK